MFPINRIMGDHEFENMDIVICGHSLGGAIASIVAIKLFIVSKYRFQERLVKCITFGAPPIGDQNLQQFVSQQMSLCIYNLVNVNDPVPKLLKYTQFTTVWLQESNKRLSMIPPNVQGPEGTSSEESTRNKLVAIRALYGKVI